MGKAGRQRRQPLTAEVAIRRSAAVLDGYNRSPTELKSQPKHPKRCDGWKVAEQRPPPQMKKGSQRMITARRAADESYASFVSRVDSEARVVLSKAPSVSVKTQRKAKHRQFIERRTSKKKRRGSSDSSADDEQNPQSCIGKLQSGAQSITFGDFVKAPPTLPGLCKKLKTKHEGGSAHGSGRSKIPMRVKLALVGGVLSGEGQDRHDAVG